MPEAGFPLPKQRELCPDRITFCWRIAAFLENDQRNDADVRASEPFSLITVLPGSIGDDRCIEHCSDRSVDHYAGNSVISVDELCFG
jgi:hypothetical protein